MKSERECRSTMDCVAISTKQDRGTCPNLIQCCDNVISPRARLARQRAVQSADSTVDSLSPRKRVCLTACQRQPFWYPSDPLPRGNNSVCKSQNSKHPSRMNTKPACFTHPKRKRASHPHFPLDRGWMEFLSRASMRRGGAPCAQWGGLPNWSTVCLMELGRPHKQRIVSRAIVVRV